jgi:leucyl/phenylalanyl-tRNA--protein transferase
MLKEPPIIWLPEDFQGPFPSPDLALLEPDGLLAAGGNLKPDTLLQAYKQGIFPWYSGNQPILWWSPNPRCVLYPEKLHISRSLRRTLNKAPYTIKKNTAFKQVVLECAAPRENNDNEQPGTWITDAMADAYCALHELGHAHSIESWQGNNLVGGIYGVKLGQVFFGESMFSRMKDASKVAMVYLCENHKYRLIDAQVHSEHLESLGAECIDRYDFIQELDTYC